MILIKSLLVLVTQAPGPKSDLFSLTLTDTDRLHIINNEETKRQQ